MIPVGYVDLIAPKESCVLTESWQIDDLVKCVSVVNKKLNDLIGEIDKGVLLRGEAMGSHLINPIKGSMAITCLNALYIEDGEVKYPLKAVSMSSDYFEFLNKIEKVGADQRIVYQGKLAPIIVRGVHFS